MWNLQHPVFRPLGLTILLLRRLGRPLGILIAIFVIGSVGFWLLGWYYGRGWSLLDAAYMTSITLTTVGFEDYLSAKDLAAGKLYTMALIVAGMGATAYSVSSLTAFILEGHFGRVFKEARVKRMVEQLSQHTIICGCGETGVHVVEEHLAAKRPFVIVDKDAEKVYQMLGRDDLPFIEGDATREEVLERAGIGRARALVAALTSDKDNLFLVVTARYLRKDLDVVAKCIDHESVPKFRAAGATHVVSPTYIGGLRIASHVLRPHVVDFLDGMLREGGGTRVAETRVEVNSGLCGRTLKEARLDERASVVVIGLRRAGDAAFTYSPSLDTRLDAGSVIVAIGTQEHLDILEQIATAEAVPTRR